MKIKQKTLKNGLKSYYFRIVLNGRPTMKSGFTSKKEATNAYRAYKVAEANGQLESQKTKRVKFSELAEEWLKTKAKSVKPSTLVKIKERYKLHIKPYFAGMYLDELTPIKAQKFVNHIASKLVGYTDTLDIVNQVYKKAVQYGYLDKNPFDSVDRPRTKKAPVKDSVKFYDKEQLIKFLTSAYNLYAKDHYSRYVFFRLLAFTGMRKGEALALQWSDINLVSKQLTIYKTIVTTADGEKVSNEAKTKASNRTIMLDNDTVKVLSEWKYRQHEQFKELGYPSSPCEFVFNSEVNSFVNLSRPRMWARSIAKSANLPAIIIHGFRHTYATLAVQAGMDIKQLQYQLGHNDVHTTLQIYAEVTQKQKTETASIFANFVNESNIKSNI